MLRDRLARGLLWATLRFLSRVDKSRIEDLGLKALELLASRLLKRVLLRLT